MLSMPRSVRVAAAACALVVVIQAALLAFLASQGQAWAQSLVTVGALGLLLAGLVRRWRIAWLWGRFLGFFLAALLAAFAFAEWRSGSSPAVLAILLPGIALPLLVMSLALGLPSAPGWFGLTCPTCGATTARSADLLFRKARCRSCQAEW
ncbi:MAG TPA: hypothetical protein VFP50_02600 [Anaeromyxobacteraceae bacterium]|nr:hypothetical protein [Anaeromyxobacteraceae bacterium]